MTAVVVEPVGWTGRRCPTCDRPRSWRRFVRWVFRRPDTWVELVVRWGPGVVVAVAGWLWR